MPDRPQTFAADVELTVAVAYRIGVVYVKFVGTHAQYDAIDAETVETG